VEVSPGEHVEKQYVVRLLFKFDALDPADAVNKMITELTDHGLRYWTYRVEDLEAEELYFVSGSTGESLSASDVAGLLGETEDEHGPDSDSERLPDPHASAQLDALIRLGRDSE
jgi:hypothetical protein